MFLTWGICFVFEDGKDKCTAVCPYSVWVRLLGPKGQGVLAEGLCCSPAEPLRPAGRTQTGQQAVPLPCLLSGRCLAGCFSWPLRLLLPRLCSLPGSGWFREFTWILENEPVTWRDCDWYSRSLGLKNWLCPPPLPALLHLFSDSGIHPLSYVRSPLCCVTTSKASVGKKTLTSAKSGWGFALHTFSRFGWCG